MRIVEIMIAGACMGLLVIVAVLGGSSCSRQEPARDEIPVVRLKAYERWADAMLGHHDVRALCAGWDTNNDGYESCDVLDTRTGRTYALSCPFGFTLAQECKLRPAGTAP